MDINRTLVGLQQGIATEFENISRNITVAAKLIDIYALLDENGSEHYKRQLDLLQLFTNFYSTQQPREIAPTLPTQLPDSSSKQPREIAPTLPTQLPDSSSKQPREIAPTLPTQLPNTIDELAMLDEDHPAAELYDTLIKSFEEEDDSIAKHIENCRRACEEMKNIPKEDTPAPLTVHIEEEYLSETETVNSISQDERNEFLSNLTDERQNKLLAVIHHLAKEEINKYKVPADKKEDLIIRAANRIRDNYIKTKGRSICLDNYTL